MAVRGWGAKWALKKACLSFNSIFDPGGKGTPSLFKFSFNHNLFQRKRNLARIFFPKSFSGNWLFELMPPVLKTYDLRFFVNTYPCDPKSRNIFECWNVKIDMYNEIYIADILLTLFLHLSWFYYINSYLLLDIFCQY